MARKMVRQGDVLFRPIDRQDFDRHKGMGLTATARRVVVHGEATGHAHRLTDESDAVIYVRDPARRSAPSVMLLEVNGSGAEVTHEEHKPVQLQPGLYEVLQAREFDYTAQIARRVVD